MSEEEPDVCRLLPLLVGLLLLLLVSLAEGQGDSLDIDREVLLQLKAFLNEGNVVNRGPYVRWDDRALPVCDWPGITCGDGRVVGIDLSESNISNTFFHNFSGLSQLTHLDLSNNAIAGPIHPSLGRCVTLRYLNLSHNLLNGSLDLAGLTSLETLDLTLNRLDGPVGANFPALCSSLRTLNLSTNRFTGGIANAFDGCGRLQSVDLSSNNFSGPIWPAFASLLEFSVSENNLTGEISPQFFQSCSLESLDLSGNLFTGAFPEAISNCQKMNSLNIWGNQFSGNIPTGIGSLPELESLLLGNNSFPREIPESLLNCKNLTFLDMSRNNFGGDVQPIFGRFRQLKYLVLHSNNYTGGIISSGVIRLPKLVRLDLSFNNFSGPLPAEIANMATLRFLILSYNHFSGQIPSEYGRLSSLQAMDLSFNRLIGPIPPTIGNLTSLLWLMLANNSLTGEIPREIGNCSSLLWLNLADNQLSGNIPAEFSGVGSNPEPTFESNRRLDAIRVASGECLAMKRWIPASYPPFSFVYNLLTRKSCRSIWDRLLKGYGLFPVCSNLSGIRILAISGYVQLSGNQLSGEIPPEFGGMRKFTLLQLGSNEFSGRMPPEIAKMPLVMLNVSSNRFSGEIPEELGNIKCMQNLDLSQNNFSGPFPGSLNRLTDLSKFNVSYNPLLSGTIPATGQLATFEADSFLGNPLLVLGNHWRFTPPPPSGWSGYRRSRKPPANQIIGLVVFLTVMLAFIACCAVYIIARLFRPSPTEAVAAIHLLHSKRRHDVESSSADSSDQLSDPVKVIQLGKTVAFTYADIVAATRNFTDEAIIGKGGFGTVYKGLLPDGKEVAVKKLQREGPEGEREFRAEMEVLSGGGGWPHPNLVPLYGWCLYGSQKLLVYEYMGGGSLEELLSDRSRLNWRHRVDLAIGVARALVFLHHEYYPAVVHRDVKASNVLLDGEGHARLTDFGLARMVGPEATHVSTMVAGTVGYVAPEYGHVWRATTRGDVYSFGVLAMELATGRRAVDGGDECLVEWVKRVTRGEGHEGLRGAVVAVMMATEAEEEALEGLREMCELLRVGMRCTAESPKDRPDMKEVLAALQRIADVRQPVQ